MKITEMTLRRDNVRHTDVAIKHCRDVDGMTGHPTCLRNITRILNAHQADIGLSLL